MSHVISTQHRCNTIIGRGVAHPRHIHELSVAAYTCEPAVDGVDQATFDNMTVVDVPSVNNTVYSVVRMCVCAGAGVASHNGLSIVHVSIMRLLFDVVFDC